MYGKGDTKEAAKKAAHIFQDRRVVQFYDPDKLSGKAVATSLGAHGNVAWDIYLFYEKGAEWGDCLPQPAGWLHQLVGRSWADQAHLYCGEDLLRRLHDVMQKLSAQ